MSEASSNTRDWVLERNTRTATLDRNVPHQEQLHIILISKLSGAELTLQRGKLLGALDSSTYGGIAFSFLAFHQ